MATNIPLEPGVHGITGKIAIFAGALIDIFNICRASAQPIVLILVSKCSILNCPTHLNKHNSLTSPKNGVIFTRTKTFFFDFLLFVFLVAMATVYSHRFTKNISQVKRVSIRYNKMYGLIYLCLLVCLHYFLISGYIQTS